MWNRYDAGEGEQQNKVQQPRIHFYKPCTWKGVCPQTLEFPDQHSAFWTQSLKLTKVLPLLHIAVLCFDFAIVHQTHLRGHLGGHHVNGHSSLLSSDFTASWSFRHNLLTKWDSFIFFWVHADYSAWFQQSTTPPNPKTNWHENISKPIRAVINETQHL